MNKYNVAVVGATGVVGRMVLEYLAERDFPVGSIEAYASENSVGKQVSFGFKDTLKLYQLDKLNFKNIDFAFLCAGSKISKELVAKAKETDCIIIDKASIFRLKKGVPLIVPEVNIADLKDFNSGLITSPNCVVIPLATTLKPLDNAAKIKRAVISTYQSVSGAGNKAMDELYDQTKAKFAFGNLEPKVFPEQIAFNLIPQVGEFLDNGSTDEEYKIAAELGKILGEHIAVSVTCVRVPVFVSHSMSVNVEFENYIDAAEAFEILAEADGILVNNNESDIRYTTPVAATEHDDVFVSRIRNDSTQKNTLNLWICTDNLRKGAALNAVQIAEELIARN